MQSKPHIEIASPALQKEPYEDCYVVPCTRSHDSNEGYSTWINEQNRQRDSARMLRILPYKNSVPEKDLEQWKTIITIINNITTRALFSAVTCSRSST